MFLDAKRVDILRKKYPAGTRVMLIYTDDPYSRLHQGDEGSVTFVDDAGTVHINWDCGSSLGMIPGVDEFRKV